MNHFPIEFPRRAAMALFGGAVAAGALGAAPSARAAQGTRMQQVIPVPESVREAPGVRCELGPDSAIGADPAAAAVAEYLAGVLRPATGYALPTGERGDLVLRLDDAGLGQAGYRLEVTAETIMLRAGTPEGLFNGVQTLRQLLPPQIERAGPQPGP